MSERIINGDFSDDLNDWTVTVNGDSNIGVDSVTGNAVTFSGGQTNTGGSISQTFAVNEGGTGTVSLDFGKVGNGNPTVTITAEITYVDPNGNTNTLASVTGTDASGPSFANRSAANISSDLNFSFVVPTGVTEVTFTITDSSTNTTNSDLYVDNISVDVVCFAAGTQIQIPNGTIDVARLCVGDLLINSSGEMKAVAWVGCRKIAKHELDVNDKLYPVRITAGALGGGIPKRDLIVSRQHRIVLSSAIAKRMFGKTEVMVPAINLVDLPGVFIDFSIEKIAYYHVMLDCHDVIIADGAQAESLFLGPGTLDTFSPETRCEIETIFPNLELPLKPSDLVKFVPTPKKRKELIRRHIKNKKFVFE